ncbi:alpha kinase [Thraustotheca clavata]|uniref:Alpha kinase n=1 Tax=Thraustotheca clavata TaxID=74557 RepID=A0A1V9ZFZ3_9STRA|nr:alpha kinase [Thraustotheca clavata]
MAGLKMQLMIKLQQAFSHFTYDHLLGILLVCDLQGVEWIYTDPQIHAVDMTKYRQGNLSLAGIMSFFASHTCNSICNAMRLTPYDGTALPPIGNIAFKALADKTMTCSCPLCGAIYTMLHSGFAAELLKYPELYCP